MQHHMLDGSVSGNSHPGRMCLSHYVPSCRHSCHAQDRSVHSHFSFEPLPYKVHCVCFCTLVRLVASNQNRHTPPMDNGVCKYLQQLPAHSWRTSRMHATLQICSLKQYLEENAGLSLSNCCLLSHEIHGVNHKDNAPCTINVALKPAAYFRMSGDIHEMYWPELRCLITRVLLKQL